MKIRSFLNWFPYSLILRFAIIALACSIPTFCGEIHDAVLAGDLAKVKALLKINPELVSQNNTGKTPLHSAVEWLGDRDVVELLLAHKADVNAKDKDGKTPMKVATEKGKTDVVELLRQEWGPVFHAHIFAATRSHPFPFLRPGSEETSQIGYP